MAVQLRSGKDLEEKTEKDESNKGEEGPEIAETLERKRKKEQLLREEGSKKKTQNNLPADIKDRRTVCKVLKDLSEYGDQHAFHRSGYTDATLCKNFERHTEQKEEDS